LADDLILKYDPFAGDFGGSDDKLFSDKMVVARKFHRCACNICNGDIHKGERHRAIREKFDGEMTTHRFCAACCEAMRASWEDDGAAIEKRTELNPYWSNAGMGAETCH